ncbi:hypothetical protein [Crateriforma conspicua]|uniref:Uncharacterized protein n=1 Tax=Crateriforma conspicua TaxID=2527996 RepID=A0A5C5Y7S9_9PLAN|nr:hypothetical protein [Crateriforma conspicua]QDV65834.1 hypothetical protein Mal65_50070 [Crateriforma conspicua]TWT71234.1 hypothetical protein Pan14r_35440 [Crateriforma conspicua]
MLLPAVPENLRDPLQRLAGYLNFSSGKTDLATLAAWNTVYGEAIGENALIGMPGWLVLKEWLRNTLRQLKKNQAAFADHQQADRVVRLLWSELLPAYLDFHSDLLFHQEPEDVFNGFFLAKAAESILCHLDRDNDADVVTASIDRLNDYVGYRPVATLENRRGEPYPHEFVRPIPLYLRDVGVSAGPYQAIIELTLQTLRDTDESICRAAGMDLDRLDELAFDPRAYDFDHPVNRRPNYHFGGWDDRSVGDDGCFHRFVLRQVTLNALLDRVNESSELSREELLVESASVLAGTILMASGISGWGPAAYGSEITLGSLMKPIAGYRDAFYKDRLTQIAPDHAQRLVSEQQTHHQPFGAARQYLNASLAKRRAMQVQHAQLARLYARMGYPDAAKRQSDVVAVPSARLLSKIDCEVTAGLRALRAGRLSVAVDVVDDAFQRLQRAIQCGALIDPWDILGFGGNFSLYPGPENSVHDGRVDDILYVMDQLFGYIARVWSEAAARDETEAYDHLEKLYRRIAEWWRQFAAHTIDSIEATDPLESYESAKLVSRALRLWHRGGAAAGDVKFWAPHADLFDSPRAYTLVISALLERMDFVPAMALLVHWLGRADEIGLSQGGSSLPRLSERWLLRVRGQQTATTDVDGSDTDTAEDSTPPDWALVRKLFDYYEANAEQYWSAPEFNLGSNGHRKSRDSVDWNAELTAANEADGWDEDDQEENPYAAAYENVTYEDSTDDGNEGAVFEFGEENGSQTELQSESKRLTEHLAFLQSLARMWALAADMLISRRANKPDDAPEESLDYLTSWADRARENRIGLLELLDDIRNYKIKPAGTDKESMKAYDRTRLLRDSLMERVIGTAVEMSDTRRLLCAAIDAMSGKPDGEITDRFPEDDPQAVALFAALISGNSENARLLFPEFLDVIHNKSLLYIPLSRGGDPVKIYVARLRQRVLRHLVHWLPRRGLIIETCRLIETARLMEQHHPIGVGAVTEFDGLFADGFRALVSTVVHSVRQAHQTSSSERTDGDDQAVKTRRDLAIGQDRRLAEQLIPALERLTEIMLGSWLEHSKTLRLSPLETVTDPRKWDSLVSFIDRYGDPLFTQVFLQLGNIRAVLHQGVSSWLQRAIKEGDDSLQDTRLFDDLLSGQTTVDAASRAITLVYESVFDHHAEYLDYNSTTTQSDRGELIYMFLDFLRLRARYERIAWNLKPVMWAHEVLVHAGMDQAAMIWRRSLSERIGSEAEVYVQKLQKLQKEYAMRMPTVADRISERFARPMTIDRMRALVAPSLDAAEDDSLCAEFELLEKEAEQLAETPAGVGLDTPAWLTALENEVEKLAKQAAASEIDPQALMTIRYVTLSLDELNNQLAVASTQGRRLPHRR